MNTNVATLPSPRDSNIIQVFVSHRIGDEDIARKVVETIRTFTGDIVFHLSEDEPPGDKFPKWIRDKLRGSNFLLLLYTDPEENWDWCFYETGLFTPLNEEETGRVVCIYNAQSGPPPRPLAELQAVESRNDRVKLFLKKLLTTTELTGADKPLREPGSVPDQALDSAAATISGLIGPATRITKRHNPTFVVRLSKEEGIVEGTIPNTAIIESYRGALQLFEIDCEKITWGELKQKVRRQQGIYWIEEVERAIEEICSGSTPHPMISTFRSAEGGKIYRPVMVRTDYLGGRPTAFYVAFVQQYAPEAWGITDGTGHLYQLIRLGVRFRWEIIEPFIRRAARVNDDDAMRFCKQLRESIAAIEEEANIRGYLNEDFVIGAFRDSSDREIVTELFALWGAERNKISRAVEERDLGTLRSTLLGLRSLNGRFMKIVTREYASYFE